MTLNLDIVGRSSTSPDAWSWTDRDTLLYALSVGAGTEEPALSTENTRGVPQQVLPTFAVLMGYGGDSVSFSDMGDFSLQQVLHAGQRVTNRSPLPAAGSVHVTSTVTGIYDKGKHALIELSAAFTDAASGTPLAESITQIMVRGEGGFGGDPGPVDDWTTPNREPDDTVEARTSADQALLFRLNGDRNPLHSDPAFAARAGFPAPILHGLCTYGFAARALLGAVAKGDTSRFGSIAGRFSSPVFPGETLTTRIWTDEDGARFQVFAGDRIVLDRGSLRLR